MSFMYIPEARLECIHTDIYAHTHIHTHTCTGMWAYCMVELRTVTFRESVHIMYAPPHAHTVVKSPFVTCLVCNLGNLTSLSSWQLTVLTLRELASNRTSKVHILILLYRLQTDCFTCTTRIYIFAFISPLLLYNMCTHMKEHYWHGKHGD